MPGKVEELLKILHNWQKDVDASMMDQNPEYNPGYKR
jgi:hypothetical protein